MIDIDIQSAIESSWSGVTAAGDNDWSPTNAAAGHCDVTSLVVREIAGGDLKMAQVFRNGELSEHHFWNVLVDGTELDLTSAQFDGTEVFGQATLLDEAFFSTAGPFNATLTDRLDRFRVAVDHARRIGS